ncbi:uncharacterized protein C8A04DRAFT_24511 [Dichotomopilus funicola]|uniref:Uncharacterized protein n=1 Tax=Dichotomopilus funicola TaxID=1934379 RepID=A0AAN6VB21_9PEZI|nr:hypothetical protein C8A04DRAFT_24511 [Dichotomopilus funicola]
MASQSQPSVPALPVPTAPPGGEPRFEPVVQNQSTFEEMIDYIVETRRGLRARDSELSGEWIIGFHWQTDQASAVDFLSRRLDGKLVELSEPTLRRLEYDYESQRVYIDIMGDSKLHLKAQMDLRDEIKNQILVWRATTIDTRVRDLLQSIKEQGTAVIEYGNKLLSTA